MLNLFLNLYWVTDIFEDDIDRILRVTMLLCGCKFRKRLRSWFLGVSG